jgi:hypothetical protein
LLRERLDPLARTAVISACGDESAENAQRL